MQKVLTGLKPTGSITLGNYIGAISQMINYQNQYESYVFVADLHSLTVKQDPEKLHKNIRDFLALYIACGLDPKKNVIYLQSENPYIPAISWLLECTVYHGELARMIQFKEKSKQNGSFYAGLYTYPALMAADILSMDADFVPVGIDQKQHVELTNTIAQRFNATYGKTFTIPQCLVLKNGTKIMDLQNPTKKMSKSDENPKGVIELLDDESSIRKKIMSATTDSGMEVVYNMEEKPGISNLINIYSSLTGKNIETIEKEFQGKNYGEFKKCVADVVVNKITEIQSKYKEIIQSDAINTILDNGRKVTTEKAKEKYTVMTKKMGVYR
ncbi:tryptophan--tRNA ligase [bacterium]|nr:tryptophan--tRNA ligase [bacterium]